MIGCRLDVWCTFWMGNGSASMSCIMEYMLIYSGTIILKEGRQGGHFTIVLRTASSGVYILVVMASKQSGTRGGQQRV